MKQTARQIAEAVEQMAMLQYFPSDASARKGIMHLLAAIVDRAERLQWLVDAMVNHIGTWYGPVELRGVYCTRFRPADGIEAYCIQSAGFTAMDIEAENNQGHPRLDRQEAERLDGAAIRGLLQ